MIIRHLTGGRALVDREALAHETGLAEVTVRMRLSRPLAYDRRTRRALYDHDTARAALRDIHPLRRRVDLT